MRELIDTLVRHAKQFGSIASAQTEAALPTKLGGRVP